MMNIATNSVGCGLGSLTLHLWREMAGEGEVRFHRLPLAAAAKTRPVRGERRALIPNPDRRYLLVLRQPRYMMGF